ncbi:MAG: class I SAM-dependent methyltransferase [Candidatus Nanopelagicales bacterium]
MGSTLRDDLARYYDQDAAGRAERPLLDERVRRRDAFVARLVAEDRTGVVEIGTGPGADAAARRDAGLVVRGVDLSAEHVRLARERGIDAVVAPAHELPYADASFDALWSMSVLMHLPDDDLHDALREFARVLRPGAVAALGMWGGDGTSGTIPTDTIEPARTFWWRTDDEVRSIVSAYAEVEQFDTWSPETVHHYQWVVARFEGASHG